MNSAKIHPEAGSGDEQPSLLDRRNHQMRPIIVLGAARSGTRLVRNLVAQLGGYREVPWDINYIWRFGNERYPDDALPSSAASPKVRRFVATQFDQIAKGSVDTTVVVEKTVGNVLRIPFVRAVFPQAKFVHVIRDGRDVVESAMRCWQAPPSTRYLLSKLRTFPWLACARYGWKYVHQIGLRRLGLAENLSSWGPRYPDIDRDVSERSLAEVCAFQWRACVDAFESCREGFDPGTLIELQYENIAHNPQEVASEIADFLQVSLDPTVAGRLSAQITAANIGKHASMQRDDLSQVLSITEESLERWGYLTRNTRLAA